MVYRLFVEKKRELAHEAKALCSELRNLLGIKSLTDVRVLNRYDVENISEKLYSETVHTVFSEPQLDIVTEELDAKDAVAFAVEYLPGQFDQRADSAEQCIQIISCGERPTIRTARVYVLSGELTEGEIAEIKKYVINPVEAREASLEKPETLRVNYEIPTEVAVLNGFCELDDQGFVIDFGGIKFIARWIDENLDHAFLFAESDTEGRKMLAAFPHLFKAYIVKNCSAEGLAVHLFDVFDKLIREESNGRAWLKSIRVGEDSKNFAYFSK